jgi:beta-phosphoglucomutase family hydrolase
MEIGAIFDWDGVIIDSRAQHEASWERLAAEETRSLPEGHFLRGFGMKNDRIIPEILGWTQEAQAIRRLGLRKEELYREVIRDGGISPLPGVREFLERLAAAEVPCVVGSSTERKNIDTILDAIGLHRFFPEIVSADDVKRGKPDPAVFLAAAKRIGLPPERCVVFEDAHVGIEAAQAAGMKVVAVATTHERSQLQNADRVVDRLDELSLEDLRALLEER